MNGLLVLTPDPTTPAICVSLETRVVSACVVLEACAGLYAVFREPRFGKGLALVWVDSDFEIGQGPGGSVPKACDGFTFTAGRKVDSKLAGE